MTPQLKRDWIIALRSGKYEQGRLTLYNQNTTGYIEATL